MSLDNYIKKEKKPQVLPKTNKISTNLDIVETKKENRRKIEDKPKNEDKTTIQTISRKKFKWVYYHDKDFNLTENKILKTLTSPSEIPNFPMSIWTLFIQNRDLVKSEEEVKVIIDKLKKKYNIENIDQFNHRPDWVQFKDKKNSLWKYEEKEVKKESMKMQIVDIEENNNDIEIDEKKTD